MNLGIETKTFNLSIDGKEFMFTNIKKEFILNNHFEKGELWENFLMNLWKDLIDDNYLCLDIGGNIGFSSVVLSKLNDTLKIHTFEPNPTLIKLIHKNVIQNNLKNITIHNIGLGNEIGEFYMTNSLETHVGNHIVKDINLQNNLLPIKIDNYKNLNLGVFDFAKIDVEGLEYEVLTSLANFLKKNTIISIEFNSGTSRRKGFFKMSININNDLDLFILIKKLFKNIIIVKRNNTLEYVNSFAKCIYICCMDYYSVNDLICANRDIELEKYTFSKIENIRTPKLSEDGLGNKIYFWGSEFKENQKLNITFKSEFLIFKENELIIEDNNKNINLELEKNIFYMIQSKENFNLVFM